MTQSLDAYQYDIDYLTKRTKSNFRLLIIIFGAILILLALFSAYIAITSEFYALLGLTLLMGLMGLEILSTQLEAVTLEKRLNFILNTPLPEQLWRNQELRYLPFNHGQKEVVEAGLRDFFILHALFPKRPLAMPSKLVDKLWHAFILDTQSYQTYCKQAFGSVFHHVPDYEFNDRGKNIRLFTWQSACRLQGIRPAHPHTLPRLFGIDPWLVSGVAVGTGAWLTYQQEMGMLYQQWHASTFNSSSSTSDTRSNYDSNYDDSCDVGVNSSGDCSCGGSGDSGSCGSGGDGGSSCGGGCGGGD